MSAILHLCSSAPRRFGALVSSFVSCSSESHGNILYTVRVALNNNSSGIGLGYPLGVRAAQRGRAIIIIVISLVLLGKCFSTSNSRACMAPFKHANGRNITNGAARDSNRRVAVVVRTKCADPFERWR